MSNPVHNDRIYLGDDPCFIIDRYPYDQILDSSDEGADDDDQTVPFPPTLDSSEEVSNPWTINNVGAVKSPGNGFYSPPPKRSILQEDIISPAKASASNGGLCHILLRRAQGSGAETPTSSIDSCTGTSASLAGTPYPLKRPADQCANHGHSCTEKFIYSRPSLHQTTVAEVKDKADDGRRHFWEDSDVASAKLLMGLGNANPNDHHQPCLGIQPRTEEKSTREDWIDHGYQAAFMDDGQSLWNDGGHVVESQSDRVPSLEPITVSVFRTNTLIFCSIYLPPFSPITSPFKITRRFMKVAAPRKTLALKVIPYFNSWICSRRVSSLDVLAKDSCSSGWISVTKPSTSLRIKKSTKT
jgi:hypothetical protein